MVIYYQCMEDFMNNAALKHEYFEDTASSTYKRATIVNNNSSQSVVETGRSYQIIARQAEEACHLRGNVCGPELDYFEEKYGICDFV